MPSKPKTNRYPQYLQMKGDPRRLLRAISAAERDARADHFCFLHLWSIHPRTTIERTRVLLFGKRELGRTTHGAEKNVIVSTVYFSC